jgi:hypothetical protein
MPLAEKLERDKHSSLSFLTVIDESIHFYILDFRTRTIGWQVRLVFVHSQKIIVLKR